MSQNHEGTTPATTNTSTRRSAIAGPIVRPATAGKTHFLRVDSLDPEAIESADFTLCNTPRNGAAILDVPGVQVTCKRCLKLDELNKTN